MGVTHLRDKFHVVTMISNPVRFRSRYILYKQFEARMQAEGIEVWVCEVQSGERKFEITDKNNPRHLQVRTKDDMWHKENALNLIIQRLPRDWEYVAWIDADIEFQNRNWVDETIHQLQLFDVVQMFQTATDMGPQGEVMQTHKGFMYSYVNGLPYKPGYHNFHSGYAWAATRYAIESLGGLVDKAILGSGDRHIAMALVGKGPESVGARLHKNYKHMIAEYSSRAERYIKRNVSYVEGNIIHYYHGSKADRQYATRWQILIEHQYDPYSDVYTDWQGLLKLDDVKVEFRDAMREYFRLRGEDNVVIALMP